MIAFKTNESSGVHGFRAQLFITHYEHLEAGTRQGGKGRAAGGGEQRQFAVRSSTRDRLFGILWSGGGGGLKYASPKWEAGTHALSARPGDDRQTTIGLPPFGLSNQLSLAVMVQDSETPLRPGCRDAPLRNLAPRLGVPGLSTFWGLKSHLLQIL
jgi:hypothetical protein